MSSKGKIERRSRRKAYIRRKVQGTMERPRVTVFRSSVHIYVQAIDDITGKTIAQASSLNDELVNKIVSETGSQTGKITVSAAVGKAIAQRLNENKIGTAVFDRNGYLYHGRVKAVADGAREAGLHM